jgi:Ca2+-binding RTX toxin-like protein
VNFDATSYGSPSTYSEDGLTFTSPTHLHFNSGDMDGDGFQELYGHSGGTDTIYITKTGGGSFSLIDMDTVVNGSVELIAYRMVSGSLVETGRMVISAGTAQVTFTAAFQNIDQVLWNSGYGGNMLVDNIRYTTGAVPPANSAPDAPVDNDAATADQLAENAANGTYAGVTLHSSDADGDAVTYCLTDDAGGRFRVDAATGAVVATGAVNIDYEHAPFSDANGRYYEVTGIATDPDGAASSPTTYKIYVTNVVETPFTEGNDGSAAQPVDFNTIRPGAYEPDGTFQYSGLNGDDYVVLPDQATVASGRNPWDYAQAFQAGNGNDMVQGGDGNDIIAGDAGNDRLFGDAGNDQLLGGSGHDVLAGGAGTDRLTGGDGRDIFLFGDSEIGSSKNGAHDVITDFTQGVDLIDISALYDGVAFAGFKFGKLSSALKNGAPVDAYKVAYYGDGVSIWVQGDTTGDGIADFTIELTGARALAGTPATVAASFIVDAAGWDGAMAGRSLAYDWAGHHQDGYWL